MTIETIRTAAHTAFLEPFVGVGALVLPNAAQDAWVAAWDGLEAGAVVSLHDADLAAMLRELARLGYVPSDPGDDWGTFVHMGLDVEGRQVVGLCGSRPIIDNPTLEQCVEADRALSIAAAIA